ncbi:MAG: TolC family outer membrane protein [Burkholderiales bacterium]
MLRARHRLALIAVLTLGAFSARAENLQELYQASLGYDATYLSARASLDAAQYRLDQVYALRRPSVGLTVNGGRSTSSTPDAPSTATANGTQYGATVSGSQSLFNRANDKTIAQAEKALEVARADFASAEQDLIVRVSQAYFDVLAAQDTLATARSSMAAISEQVASAKRNFEVGTANITDTREAQARYDLARATEIVADNDLTNKRIALDQLVGRVSIQPKQLAVPVKLPPVVPAALEDWVARADAEHPLVRKARLGLEVAKLETEKAKAGHLPTVAVSASVGRGHTSASGDFVPSGSYSYSTPTTSTSVGVTLSMPLFAGYAIQNRVKETLALETKSEDDLAAARRGVEQGTRTAFYGVRSGTAQVGALEAAESSSQLALDATQLGYKVGVRVNIDVLNAQAQLFSTQAQLAQARYNVVMAGLRLRQASGRLTAEDLTAVNALLQR